MAMFTILLMTLTGLLGLYAGNRMGFKEGSEGAWKKVLANHLKQEQECGLAKKSVRPPATSVRPPSLRHMLP